jgi:acetyl-CoA carboxylase carboxyltransferase component
VIHPTETRPPAAPQPPAESAGDRFAGLFDPGSFRDLAVTGGLPGVAGRGSVDGRPVMVVVDEGTGDGPRGWATQMDAERLTRRLRIPLVRLFTGPFDPGTGYFGKRPLPPGLDFTDQVELLSEVPVVAVVAGSVAGAAAIRAVMTHLTVMTEDSGRMVVAALPDITHPGEDAAPVANGSVDILAATESDAWTQVSRFLSYLPSSVWELPPVIEPRDPPAGQLLGLTAVGLPRDGRRLIAALVDEETFFETGVGWGAGTITGLARLGGFPVAVITSDPRGGALTAAGADKLRRLVDLADTFHLPVVNLVDQPGFAAGPAAEEEATVRHGAGLIASLAQATNPFFTVLVRRSAGVAGAVLVNQGDTRVAWPLGDRGHHHPGERPQESVDARQTRPLMLDWLSRVWSELPARLGHRPFRYRP